MKIERRSSLDEHTIVVAMITDDLALSAVAERWEPDMFGSRWANLIAKWCYDYWRKYKKAPRRHIETLFASWAAKHEDQEKTVALVERFLGSLSKEYTARKESPNTAYIVDLAGNHFNQRRLLKLKEEIEEALDAGDLERAKDAATKFNVVEMGEGEAVNVLDDPSAIDRAFQSVGIPLIKYPGDAGGFFNASLERDGFVSFMAPEKAGKSWFLIDLAARAIDQGNKVAFFAIGDLSEPQMMMRFMVRLTGRPMESGKLKIPTEMYRDKDSDRVEIFSEFDERQKITPTMAKKYFAKKKKELGPDILKLSVHPNSTITTRGMHSILERWSRTGWVPDVIVVDYADLLSPPPGFQDREGINQTWKELRSLSQSLHCLVVTATQSDADSYGKEVLTMANFSEDKRKNAHVTAMIGIAPIRRHGSKMKRDKGEASEWKLNFTMGPREREDPGNIRVAGCLGIGNPVILSVF